LSRRGAAAKTVILGLNIEPEDDDKN